MDKGRDERSDRIMRSILCLLKLILLSLTHILSEMLARRLIEEKINNESDKKSEKVVAEKN